MYSIYSRFILLISGIGFFFFLLHYLQFISNKISIYILIRYFEAHEILQSWKHCPWRYFKNVWMWCLGTWFCGGLGSAMLIFNSMNFRVFININGSMILRHLNTWVCSNNHNMCPLLYCTLLFSFSLPSRAACTYFPVLLTHPEIPCFLHTV